VFSCFQKLFWRDYGNKLRKGYGLVMCYFNKLSQIASQVLMIVYKRSNKPIHLAIVKLNILQFFCQIVGLFLTTTVLLLFKRCENNCMYNVLYLVSSSCLIAYCNISISKRNYLLLLCFLPYNFYIIHPLVL